MVKARIAYHVLIGQIFGNHVLIVGDVEGRLLPGGPDPVEVGVLPGGPPQGVSS
jgi:hypothetical protein